MVEYDNYTTLIDFSDKSEQELRDIAVDAFIHLAKLENKTIEETVFACLRGHIRANAISGR